MSHTNHRLFGGHSGNEWIDNGAQMRRLALTLALALALALALWPLAFCSFACCWLFDHQGRIQELAMDDSVVFLFV